MRRNEILRLKRVIFPRLPKTPLVCRATGLIPVSLGQAVGNTRPSDSQRKCLTSAANRLEGSQLSNAEQSPHPVETTFNLQLEDCSVPLQTLLDQYDLTSPIPFAHLVPLLRHPSSPSTIITLTPSVIAYIEDFDNPMYKCVELLERLSSQMGNHQMLALLPPVVQSFLQRVDVEVERGGQCEVGELQRWYQRIIHSLRYFSGSKANSTASYNQGLVLPLPIRMQVTQMISHLMEVLSSLPSSSDQYCQPRISSSFLKLLITRRYLTPELRKMLVRHTWSHGIDLTPSQWHQCTISAMDEGNERDAKRYRKRKQIAIDKRQPEQILNVEEDLSEFAGNMINHFGSGQSLRAKEISRLISEMVIAKYDQSIDDLLPTLEPFLYPDIQEGTLGHEKFRNDMRGTRFKAAKYDVNSLLRYAWSILIHRSTREKKVTGDALLEMAETLPGEAVVGHTLTPIMHGLIKRGEPLKAWDIWRDLINHEKNATFPSKGLFIDRITLAVAMEACYSASNLEAAVTLVDTWAKKRMIMDESGNEDTMAGSIQLDAQNINILLNLCRRDGKASIAFRLWSAALPRYGVYLDDISLNLLLDIARYSDNDLEDEISLSRSEENELFKRRLRAFADEFRFRRRHRQEAELSEMEDEDCDEIGYSNENERSDMINSDEGFWGKSPTSILINDPEFAFRFRKDKGGLEIPWKKARRIFRQVVLGNWPHLREIKSPLEIAYHQGVSFGSIASFFGHSPSPDIDTDQDGESNNSKVEDREIRLPSVNARFTHIIPTSNTFKSYIALLGYYNRHSEIALTLGWMKSLDVKPTWSTMCLALLHICEAEGPRRWVKGFGENGNIGLVRDEEIVRKWLQQWLGEQDENDGKGGRRSIVPTEQDVARSRRWLAERRQKLTA
ncbi:uncharacterized protein IL334_004944 [Kwoniella shivajii]|uniref:ATPase synthesis protein 25 n=1 Tax=Kwoniella shivajii TaxID=564305 RepID=A0ABZ1D3I4_9TREE|nr:hypothetical protein IL334_004944 [Kwoniella shivajii]